MLKRSTSNVFRFIARLSVVALIFLVAIALMVAIDIPGNSDAQPVQKYQKDVLHLKLKETSGVSLVNGRFIGGPTDQTKQLNDLLSSSGEPKAEKLKNATPQTPLQQKLHNALINYYRLKLAGDVDMPLLISDLKSLGIIETAYAEPTPAPAPASPNYTSAQNYLKAAPDGINANIAKTYPGGTGANVRIIDVEYSWNTLHEDITKARTATVASGTPVDPFANNNHGTAVIGELAADDNSYGVTGAVPGANLSLINANNAERGYDPVGALNAAAAVATAGDIVVIEQQTWGPTSEIYDFVPLEWLPEVYDAIKVLTNNGVIVVEAGGNGNQNLDNNTYYGNPFPMSKPDSGAIIVGAGLNCSGSARLSRASYSNYGVRVNVQGPGDCVATTGYGDLYSAGGMNTYYTGTFSGTSSATPVVAAAAASLSSVYEALYGGSLTPVQIRDSLIRNATAQNTSGGTLAGRIGPYPDLAKVLAELGTGQDTSPPSTPQNLAVILNFKNKPVLSWSASADNVGVSGYRIYRNGVYYASSLSTSFTDTSAKRRTTYSYQVAAIDSAGNMSALSTAVSVKTR